MTGDQRNTSVVESLLLKKGLTERPSVNGDEWRDNLLVPGSCLDDRGSLIAAHAEAARKHLIETSTP